MNLPKAKNVPSSRLKKLAKKLDKKEYRDAYLSSHLRLFLANQITALRGKKSQSEFGKLIGKPQSVVSRLENSSYGKVTIQTLLDIASKLNIALLLRFVDYPTFLAVTDDLSDNVLKPRSYNSIEIDFMVNQSKTASPENYIINKIGKLNSNTGSSSSLTINNLNHSEHQHA